MGVFRRQLATASGRAQCFGNGDRRDGGMETEDSRDEERTPIRERPPAFPVDASRRRKMAQRKGSPTSRESASSQREGGGMDELDAWEVENAQRLDKLPPEVWEKIH